MQETYLYASAALGVRADELFARRDRRMVFATMVWEARRVSHVPLMLAAKVLHSAAFAYQALKRAMPFL